MKLTVNVRVINARPNKKGEVPIYFRLTIDGQRAEFASGYYSKPDAWDTTAQQVKSGFAGADIINQSLTADKHQLQKIYTEYKISGTTCTVIELRNRFQGKQVKKHSLLKVLEHFLADFKSQIGSEGFSSGRYQRYVVFQGKMERFLGKKYKTTDINLDRLNHIFIQEFEIFLKVQEKLDIGTTGVYLKILKRIVRVAISNEWLMHDPFAAFKCKTKRVDRPYLTESELQTLLNKDFVTDRLAIVRDLFVFSSYTGLAYSDLFKLTQKNIVAGVDGQQWLNVSRTKTGEPCRIPLLPPAKDILNRYSDHPECSCRQKLLPVRANQKMNEYLKEISIVCGIQKNITFHSARHTFATTVLLTNGISLEATSKLLGHRNIRTTQIYARMTDTRIADEMNLLTTKLKSKI